MNTQVLIITVLMLIVSANISASAASMNSGYYNGGAKEESSDQQMMNHSSFGDTVDVQGHKNSYQFSDQAYFVATYSKDNNYDNGQNIAKNRYKVIDNATFDVYHNTLDIQDYNDKKSSAVELGLKF